MEIYFLQRFNKVCTFKGQKKKLNEGAQTQKVEKRKRKAGTPQLQK